MYQAKKNSNVPGRLLLVQKLCHICVLGTKRVGPRIVRGGVGQRLKNRAVDLHYDTGSYIRNRLRGGKFSLINNVPTYLRKCS
jgi:hypothetical protein